MSFPPAACTYPWDPSGFCDPTVTQNTKSIQFEGNQAEKTSLNTILFPELVYRSVLWFWEEHRPKNKWREQRYSSAGGVC